MDGWMDGWQNAKNLSPDMLEKQKEGRNGETEEHAVEAGWCQIIPLVVILRSSELL